MMVRGWSEPGGRRMDGIVFGLALVVQVAVVFLITSSGYLRAYNFMVSYGDPISHLNVARRVFDSPTPGLSQLGGTWLPLPHLMLLPLVLLPQLYQLGLAGAVLNVVCLSLTAVYLSRLARGMGHPAAGLVVVATLLLNTRTLVLATTAMTEVPYMFLSTLSAYHFLRWYRQRRWQDLVLTAVATCLASLTRYEGWVLPVIYSALATGVLLAERPRPSYKVIEGHIMVLGPVAFSGPFLWLLWNTIIFRNPFNFMQDPASPRGLAAQARTIPLDPMGALMAMANSTLLYFGPAILVLALLAVPLYCRRTGSRDLGFVFLLGSPAAVTLLALIKGQATAPYGIVDLRLVSYLAPPVALALAVLPFLLHTPHQRTAAVGAVLLLLGSTFAVQALAPVQEIDPYSLNPQASPTQYLETFDDTHPYYDAARWLRGNYDLGPLLIGLTGGKEIIMYFSDIDLLNYVDPGNHQLFNHALVKPQDMATWVIIARRPIRFHADPVADALLDNATGLPRASFLVSFDKRYENSLVAVYRAKPGVAPLPFEAGGSARAFAGVPIPAGPGPPTLAASSLILPLAALYLTRRSRRGRSESRNPSRWTRDTP